MRRGDSPEIARAALDHSAKQHLRGCIQTLFPRSRWSVSILRRSPLCRKPPFSGQVASHGARRLFSVYSDHTPSVPDLASRIRNPPPERRPGGGIGVTGTENGTSVGACQHAQLFQLLGLVGHQHAGQRFVLAHPAGQHVQRRVAVPGGFLRLAGSV